MLLLLLLLLLSFVFTVFIFVLVVILFGIAFLTFIFRFVFRLIFRFGNHVYVWFAFFLLHTNTVVTSLGHIFRFFTLISLDRWKKVFVAAVVVRLRAICFNCSSSSSSSNNNNRKRGLGTFKCCKEHRGLPILWYFQRLSPIILSVIVQRCLPVVLK